MRRVAKLAGVAGLEMTMTTEYEEDRGQFNENYLLSEDDTIEVLITGTVNDVEVWLNRGTDYNGLAIGSGESRASAMRDAVDTLERALKVLRKEIK